MLAGGVVLVLDRGVRPCDLRMPNTHEGRWGGTTRRRSRTRSDHASAATADPSPAGRAPISASYRVRLQCSS